MLKSILTKVLLLAVIAFAFTACTEEQVAPASMEENVAFSSNAAPVFDTDIEFQRPRNISEVKGGGESFFVGTAWSKTTKSHVAVYSKDGMNNWKALNPARKSGLSGFLADNNVKFVGVLNYLFPGMGSQGVSVLYIDNGKLMAQRFWRVEPNSEIMKYKRNTREDRPIEVDMNVYNVVGRTHRASKEDCPFDFNVAFIGNTMFFVNEAKTGFSMIPPRKANGRNTGSGKVSRLLEGNEFVDFIPSCSSDIPNMLMYKEGGNMKTVELYAHWGEVLHDKLNKEAKGWSAPHYGCAKNGVSSVVYQAFNRHNEGPNYVAIREGKLMYAKAGDCEFAPIYLNNRGSNATNLAKVELHPATIKTSKKWLLVTTTSGEQYKIEKEGGQRGGFGPNFHYKR